MRRLGTEIGQCALHLEKASRGRYEIIDIAVKAFELSQELRSKWLTADYAAKRRILEIICLNFSLEGVTLVPTMRKPFDMLAEGLDLKNSRGDKTAIELFRCGVASSSDHLSVACQALTTMWT